MNHSQEVTNPPGGAGPRRSDTQPALDDDLLERVLASANLKLAWKQVKANQGAAGVDGMSIEAFPAFAREHWSSVRKALLDGTYQPTPLRQQMIPKPDGRGLRQLRIPTVLDRVILQAIQQVLTPILDPNFSESSSAIDQDGPLTERSSRSSVTFEPAIASPLTSTWRSFSIESTSMC